ncbi:Choline-sulfatase [Tsuneonella dongtanensis]|uniref:Choline-sulfatase n=1 Tax=Tsuneonella dongtanensis TaxID=692370 RepID=A0A1B2AB40_9SPHN|nr:sulfatase [Tsuneonella dongtanensis]ANY19321.1 Choline-sulfatase [Tsuneonella dongtanensis]
MRFDTAYANQAVCAPSQFNLMMGSRSSSTGIYNFGMNMRDYYPDTVTMPQWFMRAGYHTESMGKVFHFGHGTYGDEASWSVPHHKDHVIEYHGPASTPGGAVTREEAYFNEKPHEGAILELPKGAAYESPDVSDETYADGRTAAYAIQRLEALKGSKQPFFMAVGFARPHMPFSVPKKYWDMYDPAKMPMPEFEDMPEGAPAFAGKVGGEVANYFPVPGKVTGKEYPRDLVRTMVQGYYAGVSYTDAQVGKVLAELDRLGLRDDTIVVLWGDHGFHLGDHGLWTKHTNYEQATRIPLIFAGPGVGAGGRSTGQPAETVDIYTTLASLAGLSHPTGPQPIDGLDLSPVFADPAARVRPYAYHVFNRPDRLGQAIRTERYRLVRWTQQRTKARDYELNDLVADPGEHRNLAKSDPATVKRLDAYIDALPPPASIYKKEAFQKAKRAAKKGGSDEE